MERLEALKQVGNEWQKGNYHRIYFNSLGTRLGVETWRYNTGNISYAEQDGSKISNSQARRILNRCGYSKVWYDVKDGKFHTKGGLLQSEFERIVEGIEAECAELGAK